MNNLKNVVAKNLIKFRMIESLTQAELAKKINYSDKTISKWEKGERLPDLEVLVSLSEIYNISINDFLNEKTEQQEIVISKKFINNQHTLISLLSVGLVLFLSAIVFVILSLIEQTCSIAFLSFVYAVPICLSFLLFYSFKWWNSMVRIFFSSLLMWGLFFAIYLTFSIENILIYIIFAIIIQILIIVFFALKDSLIKKNK